MATDTRARTEDTDPELGDQVARFGGRLVLNALAYVIATALVFVVLPSSATNAVAMLVAAIVVAATIITVFQYGGAYLGRYL